MHPSDRLLLDEGIDSACYDFGVGKNVVDSTGGSKALFDLLLVVARAKIGARHAVFPIRNPAVAEISMPNCQCRPESATSIACGRLDPDVLEDTLLEEPAVGDAVQRNTAGEA